MFNGSLCQSAWLVSGAAFYAFEDVFLGLNVGDFLANFLDESTKALKKEFATVYWDMEKF